MLIKDRSAYGRIEGWTIIISLLGAVIFWVVTIAIYGSW